jgi:uncharacterized membrane protein YeiH
MRTCKLMQTAVLGSATLLVGGILMEILAQTTPFTVSANVAAIGAVLGSAILMLAAFVVGVLPTRITHLDECQH